MLSFWQNPLSVALLAIIAGTGMLLYGSYSLQQFYDVDWRAKTTTCMSGLLGFTTLIIGGLMLATGYMAALKNEFPATPQGYSVVMAGVLLLAIACACLNWGRLVPRAGAFVACAVAFTVMSNAQSYNRVPLAEWADLTLMGWLGVMFTMVWAGYVWIAAYMSNKKLAAFRA